MVIQGTLTLTNGQPGKYAGHFVLAVFRRQTDLASTGVPGAAAPIGGPLPMVIPAASRVPVSDDGHFTLNLPDPQTINADVAIEVLAPSGQLLLFKSYPPGELPTALTLAVDPLALPSIPPLTDPFAGRSPKLTGRVVDRGAKHKASAVQVLLFGAPKPADAAAPLTFKVVLFGITDANGYFFGDYPTGPFAQAYGVVGVATGEQVPIPLNGQAFPQQVTLPVDVPAPPAHADDCTCHDAVPRAPGPQDLVNSPETYSTDLGGGKCVNLTVPNRALEEFSFFRVVRTTEPEIKGLHQLPTQKIPAGLLGPLLDMVAPGAAAGQALAGHDGERAAQPFAAPTATGAQPDVGSGSEALPEWASGGNFLAGGPAPADPTATGGAATAGVPPGSPVIFSGHAATSQPSPQSTAAANAAMISHLAATGGIELDPSVLRQQLILRDPESLGAVQLAKAGQLTTMNQVTESLRLLTGPPVPGRAPMDADNPADWDEETTFYQASSIAHGHVLHFKQVWRADGYSLGDLLYSLPLAPDQKKEIAVVDWDRRETAARSEDLFEQEQLDASMSHDRDISEIVGSTLRESTHGGSDANTSAIGGGLGIQIGPIILGGAGGASNANSTAWQDSSRSLSGNSMQALRDQTLQSSSMLRSQRATVVQTVQQGERMTVTTEVVHNHNHCHAITIEYFEVLRHFQVSQELADVQECLFIPLLMASFDSAKALRWRRPLRAYLQDQSLFGGFDALDRIATNYAGSDLPTGRYADETIEDLEGELRISFVIPRPQDKDDDDTFVYDNWKPWTPFLWDHPLAIFNQYLLEARKAERDRIFRTQIAPRLADKFVRSLRFFYLDSGRGRTEIKLDSTLVSDFAQDVPLLVTLRPATSVLSPRARADVAYFEIRSDVDLPPDSKAIVHSSRVRYRTAHLTHFLVNDFWVKSELLAGTPTVMATPMDRQELRNPREEDSELATRLLAHLNAHTELYHKAIWWSMDADRRFMMLDGFLAPNGGGRSVASVIENRLIGLIGNCLVMPVARGFHLDPTYQQDLDHPVDLFSLYAPNTPIPPMRISAPTRGVFAEAVMGSCSSCEKKDDTRFWRWEQVPSMSQPTTILPVGTESPPTQTPGWSPRISRRRSSTCRMRRPRPIQPGWRPPSRCWGHRTCSAISRDLRATRPTPSPPSSPRWRPPSSSGTRRPSWPSNNIFRRMSARHWGRSSRRRRTA